MDALRTTGHVLWRILCFIVYVVFIALKSLVQFAISVLGIVLGLMVRIVCWVINMMVFSIMHM